MSYEDEILLLFNEVSEKLIDWGIPSSIVSLDQIGRMRNIPTRVGSEFLMNKALGDWAEEQLIDAFDKQFPDYVPTKYGNSENIAAGDPNFSSFFRAYVEELKNIGKRPDILIFQRAKSQGVSKDISNLETGELSALVREASYAIEVRSSKIKASKYRQYRAQNRGSSGSRKELSITPKVEDLPLVVKWISKFGVPHYYFQVFLDEVYGISFKQILEFILKSNKKGIIERNRNNAEKATIHVPFSEAKKIGEFEESVQFESKIYEDERGRINPYVAAKGGRLVLDKDALKLCLEG